MIDLDDLEGYTEVPIAVKDYKSAATGRKVSVKALRDNISALLLMVDGLRDAIDETKRELSAIIEEIGEEW